MCYRKYHPVTLDKDKGKSLLLKFIISDGIFTLINQDRSEDGRQLILNCSIDDNNVTLVCLYAPNKMQERQHFFNGENNWIKKNMMFEDDIIISGDLNCCLREID